MVRAIALVLLAAISQPTADWDQWREHRRARLLSEDGWLTLAGLYWLHEGVNDIAPLHAKFLLKNGQVTLLPKTPLRDDTDPKGPTIIRSGTQSYQIIKRADVKGD
ncbi:MAG: hypothetical protein DMF59_20055, partial [Acidobacteria bacterium]